jgi:[ribosomal protein S18]-alanine N-acetyltransferase
MPVIRAGEAADLNAIAAIQQASPEAAQWAVAGYLDYNLSVATYGKRVAGFLVWRALGACTEQPECEILNLAVSPDLRRNGIGRALIRRLVESFPGAIFLEVRASNPGAIGLYKSLGFQQVGIRPWYYTGPPEAAIVMKFHSC